MCYAICKAYFGRMRHGDHKLNKLLPDAGIIPHALRSFNELTVSMANTNTTVFITLSKC